METIVKSLVHWARTLKKKKNEENKVLLKKQQRIVNKSKKDKRPEKTKTWEAMKRLYLSHLD